MVAHCHPASENWAFRPFFLNCTGQFLKLIDVDGSCDSSACKKQLVVYRPFGVLANEEKMFVLVGSISAALVALHRAEARLCVAHRCHRGSNSHLQSLDFSKTPFCVDGGGKTDGCQNALSYERRSVEGDHLD